MSIKVLIKETYVYELEIEADSNRQAIKKAKEIYESDLTGKYIEYRFTADADSLVKTVFSTR